MIFRPSEIGFEEKRTSEIVAQKLGEWGSKCIAASAAPASSASSAAARRAGVNRAIGLPRRYGRAADGGDNSFAHRSQNPGRMHACGHDGHTAMLLGAAKVWPRRATFPARCILIFQPAEEAGRRKGDARRRIVRKFPCDAVYGIHNSPDIPLAAGEGADRHGDGGDRLFQRDPARTFPRTARIRNRASTPR